MFAPRCKTSLLLSALFVFLPFFVGAQSLININTASSSGLETLNGIGEAKAQAIIDYRNQNGPFQTIEEIKNVSGIGEVTFANIKDFITVGSNPPPLDESNDVVETQTTTTSNSAKPITLPLSNLKIEIDASSVATVGAPVPFVAKNNFSDSLQVVPSWSFGDGSVGYGFRVEHTYFYPGEHVVMVNTSFPNGVIADRTTIKVISPELLVSKATTERIELTNKSGREVDLFGRVLISGGESFAFPKGMIILPGQKINFASAITGLSPKNVYDVYIMTVGDNPYRSYNSVSKMEEMRLKEITKIENKLSLLQSQLALVENLYVSIVAETKADEFVEIPEVDNEFLIAGVITAEERSGLSNWWRTIKSFFLRTE